MENALTPGQDAVPDSSPGQASAQDQSGDHPIVAAMAQSHDHAKALYDRTSQAMEHLHDLGSKLSELGKLGDQVSPSNVIETAGDLVASGRFSPTEMAGYLVDMPPGGQALAGWVQQHLQNNQANLAQVKPMHELARHEMGASALRALLGRKAHQGGLFQSPDQGPSLGSAPGPAQSNSLLPPGA